MKVIQAFIIAFVVFSARSQSLNYSHLDSMIREIPLAETYQVSAVAKYINLFAKTDLEKCRGIYVFITEFIAYDDKGYNTGNYLPCDAVSVLQNKKAVCAGQAQLFDALALALHLKSEEVIGYAKGYSYQNGSHFEKSNHAWNRVFINGIWKYFDATWGNGYGYTDKNGNLVSVKQFDETWFNVSEWDMVYSHFPEDSKKITIVPKVTLAMFEKMPYYTPSQFIFKGFDGKQLYANYTKTKSWDFSPLTTKN